MSFKHTWKKVRYFIWEDDSIWSWIVNIILAFVLIKFIVYPGLGFALQTTHPIVAVVSGSMEHDGNFDTWWDSGARCNGDSCKQGEWYSLMAISKSEFKTYRFKNGFNKGDIMILYGTKTKDLKNGDIIVFWSNKRDPIIHRVVKKYTENGVFYFQTKGDHNIDSISGELSEKTITEDRIVGRAVVRVPLLGWIKIGFVELLKLFGVGI